ncbi:MAG: hypothetical protein KGI73_01875 [Patescibacteria group bacterium]|nr:hypothetical protein [Patescibacteria group bacterium]
MMFFKKAPGRGLWFFISDKKLQPPPLGARLLRRLNHRGCGTIHTVSVSTRLCVSRETVSTISLHLNGTQPSTSSHTCVTIIPASSNLNLLGFHFGFWSPVSGFFFVSSDGLLLVSAACTLATSPILSIVMVLIVKNNLKTPP